MFFKFVIGRYCMFNMHALPSVFTFRLPLPSSAVALT